VILAQPVEVIDRNAGKKPQAEAKGRAPASAAANIVLQGAIRAFR